MSDKVVERTIAITTEIVNGEKSPDEVCRSHNVDLRNYYRDLGDLKKIVKFWSEKINLINTKGLFEESFKRQLKQRQLDKKLAKAANGYYYGPPHFGYDVIDGKPFPNNNFKTLTDVMKSFLAGEPQFNISKKFHIGRHRLYYLLRDRFYRGEFPFIGKTFHGNWQLPVSQEEFDEIQSRLAVAGGRLLPGYEWKSGRKVLEKGAKEKYEKVFELRLKGYSIASISGELNVPYYTVRTMLTNRKVTGRTVVEGNLVDSGYDPAITQKIWEEAQDMKVPGYKKKQDEAQLIESKIMAYMPCYRWQLRGKVYVERGSQRILLKPTSIDKIIRRMKDAKPARIKERETDGLLQKTWEPFPDTLPETRYAGKSKKTQRILNILYRQEAALGEIRLITSIPTSSTLANLQRLIEKGLVKKDLGKYYLSELGKARVAKTFYEELPANERKLTRLLSMRRAENLVKVLKHLQSQNTTTTETAVSIGISERNTSAWLSLLEKEGIVEKMPPTNRGKWRIHEEWVAPIQKWLGRLDLNHSPAKN